MKSTTLLTLAAMLILVMIPAQAVRVEKPIQPTTHDKAICDDNGGWWHCFPNGRCGCF